MTSVSIVSWHHHHYYHHCVFNQLCKIYGNENKWTGIVVSVLRIVIWTCVYLKVSSSIFCFINRKKKNIKIQILVCNFVFARPMFRAQGYLYSVISSVSETTWFRVQFSVITSNFFKLKCMNLKGERDLQSLKNLNVLIITKLHMQSCC